MKRMKKSNECTFYRLGLLFEKQIYKRNIFRISKSITYANIYFLLNINICSLWINKIAQNLKYMIHQIINLLHEISWINLYFMNFLINFLTDNVLNFHNC